MDNPEEFLLNLEGLESEVKPLKNFGPTRRALREAMATHSEGNAKLTKAKASVAELEAKLASLMKEFDKAMNEENGVTAEAQRCRALLECHELQFSLGLCTKIHKPSKGLDEWEFDFLPVGGVMTVNTTQPQKQLTIWIRQRAWYNLTELESRLEALCDLQPSGEQALRDWKKRKKKKKKWYSGPLHERAPCPESGTGALLSCRSSSSSGASRQAGSPWRP